MDVGALRGLALFEALTDDELEKTLAVCREERFADGDTIIDEGVRSVGLFVVREGSARVYKAIGGRRVQRLAILTKGDTFGEMSLATDLPTAATVRAEGEVVCVHLTSEGFRALLKETPSITSKVLWSFVDTLARRLDQTDRTLARALQRKERYAGLAHMSALAWMQFRILSSYLWLFFRTKILRWPMKPESLSRHHRKNARRFRATASRLKGANVKLGQMASMQAHLLPKEVVEELKSLRDAVGATEYPLIAGVIQSEFGLGPLELFAEFDKVPIAAASMAQVHFAKLKTGEKVAVKVLHPGLEQSVEIDLRLMRILCTVIGWFVGKVDLKQVLAENEEPLRRELDMHGEGKATEALAAEMAPLGVIVPKVYWHYTSRRVITLELIDGVNVDDVERLKEWNVDRRALATSLARAMLHQTYGIGFFHADPHPGNLFCTREGKLAMLDFGMVKRLPEHVRLGLTKEIFGAFFAIPEMYADGLIEKGLIGESDRARVEQFAVEQLGDPKIRAMIFDHKVDDHSEATAAVGSIAETILGLETFKTPQDNMMFMRAMGITIDVCKEIAPGVPMSEIMGPLMMPLLADLMAKHPAYTEAIMKAMATMQLPA